MGPERSAKIAFGAFSLLLGIRYTICCFDSCLKQKQDFCIHGPHILCGARFKYFPLASIVKAHDEAILCVVCRLSITAFFTHSRLHFFTWLSAMTELYSS